MKLEKRGDKYFVILKDGEKEISEARLKLMQTAYIDFLEYIQIFNKVTGGEISVQDAIDKNADYHVHLERLCIELEKYVSGSAGSEAASKIIKILISQARVNIANIFKNDHVEANKYFLSRLKQIRKLYLTSGPAKTEKKPELTLRQIALIFVYSGTPITRENCDKKANKYGHNSGDKLRINYNQYQSAANRKGTPTPCTPKKLTNKIELFESVLPHLPDPHKQRAIDEINMLKASFENLYK